MFLFVYFASDIRTRWLCLDCISFGDGYPKGTFVLGVRCLGLVCIVGLFIYWSLVTAARHGWRMGMGGFVDEMRREGAGGEIEKADGKIDREMEVV